MGALEFIKQESALLGRHPLEFFTAAVIAAGVGFAVADYHYAGRIEELKETLETRQFPPPVLRHVPYPVPDASQSQIIADLNKRIDSQGATIQNLSAVILTKNNPRVSRATYKPAAPAPAAGTTSAQNQSGGVLMGPNGSIGNVNQNALPARSVFATQLGNLYTEGYLKLQRVAVKGQTDSQIDGLDNEVLVWRNKVIAFMNANMCSDAAPYFLKPHRSGLTYDLGVKQDKLVDITSWSLDNLSDIKRNDAWDCK